MKSFLFCFTPFLAFAMPTAPNIENGHATFEQIDSHLKVHTGDRAVIHWNDFSIQLDETVQFLQPNITSVAINKVIESVPSHILGKLLANGKVVLVNPSGILIGKNANIETGSFIASTLDLHEKALEKNEWFFQGTSKESVINEGTIKTNAGDAILIGYSAQNHGVMEAENGASSLYATRSILLKPEGTEHIYLKPNLANESQLETHGAFGSLLTISQEEDALIPVEVDGEILLVLDRPKATISGVMTSTYEDQGGVIHIIGDHIEVQEATLDVSHENNAGEILIGGDYQGENPNIPNASRTFISPDATISASSKSSGNGGKIIVWADEGNWCHGNINAQGGSSQGDGGFIEISGKYLDCTSTPSTFAPNGKTGTLLFDPLDLTINGADVNVTTNVTASFTEYFPNATGASLSAGTIFAAWSANNVIIRTTGTTGAQNGDLYLNAALGTFSAFDLTIDIAGDFFFNSGLSHVGAPGSGDITVLVGGNVTGNGGYMGAIGTTGSFYLGTPSNPVGGNVTMPSQYNNNIGSGDINVHVRGNLTVRRLTGGGQIGFAAGRDLNITVGGNFEIEAGGPQGFAFSDNSTSIRVGGDFTQIASVASTSTGTNGTSNQLIVGGNIQLIESGAGAIQASIACRDGDNFIQAGGDITITGNNARITNTIIPGSVTVIAGGSLFHNGDEISSSAGGPVTIVVDNNFPVVPQIGGGGITTGPNSSIYSSGSTVRIFTATRSQNNLQGPINGVLFSSVAGPLYVNSAFEQWSTYYPSLFGGLPFTIFYKDPFVGEAMEQAFVALEELFRFLHPYDEFIRSMLRFKVTYEERHDYAQSQNSFDLFNEFDYMIRRHYIKDWQVKLPVENKDL